jgi:hypothetical protein
MGAMADVLDRHHRLVIVGLVFLLAFFLVACTFHDVITVCHNLFGCDHRLHL